MYFVRKIILKSANMVNGCKCAMENGDFLWRFWFKKRHDFSFKIEWGFKLIFQEKMHFFMFGKNIA